MVNGYASDTTRTVAVGKPDDFKKEIYHLTLEAQQAAIDMIKPGVTAHDIDRAARASSKKLAMVNTSTTALDTVSVWMCMNSLLLWKEMTWCLKKACFSVEPGIYIPGKVGVRIEDCGYVTKKTALDSLQKPAKTCFTLTNPFVDPSRSKQNVSSINIKNEAGTKS